MPGNWIISEGTPTDYGGRTVRIEPEPPLGTIKPVDNFPVPARTKPSVGPKASANKHWPENELATLQRLREAGLSFGEIAGCLGRSIASCESQFYLLKWGIT